MESRYRWAVLAIGAGSTAAMAAVQGGLPALGPALQSAFGLTLVQVTAVFSAPLVGRALLRPLVADEDRRRRERHARLASA